MVFLVSQHGQLGAIPPPFFLSVFPLEYMRSRGAITPLKRGISAILPRYPMKTRQMGAIPPSAIRSFVVACLSWAVPLGWWPSGALEEDTSETGRIQFRGARFQTPNSVSFSGLTEFWEASSVSSSQPIICVPKRTHRVFCRTHRVCRGTQWVLFSETVLSKQYSARFLTLLR